MKSKGIVVRRRMGVSVAWDSLDDEGDETGQEGGDDKGTDSPDEDLATNNDTAEIDVLLLLLLAGAKQPALLGLVERARESSPVEVLKVSAAVIVGGRVSSVNLKGTTPWIPSVHAHILSRSRSRSRSYRNQSAPSPKQMGRSESETA
nr:hypothetical protein CFP56_38239 [Quercus suber]